METIVSAITSSSENVKLAYDEVINKSPDNKEIIDTLLSMSYCLGAKSNQDLINIEHPKSKLYNVNDSYLTETLLVLFLLACIISFVLFI